MEIGKLSPKFQVTIPTGIRQTLDLNAGDRILFHVNRDGEVVIRAVKEISAKNLAGSLRRASETTGDAGESVEEQSRSSDKHAHDKQSEHEDGEQ